ncbi:MAG TPA: hypothetical protein VKU02_24565 [Gemmataceae bacterium]|nr:hypothetical protein [Gemmataceae bacterium]
MSRDRHGKPVRSWRTRLLSVAIALAVGLAAGQILAQETRLPRHEWTTMLAPSVADAPEEFGPRAPWTIRVVLVIVGLSIWHTTQRMLGERQPASVDHAERAARFLSEHDRLLCLTEPANRFLNDHPRWANALLLVSSLLIDGLGLFLFVWSMVGPSIRPFLGLCILFGLRQVCQVLTALPPPPGSIWRSPGFPSLFVTYGVSNDLFFSGHTALAVYGAVELAGLGSIWLMGLATAIAIFETTAVLLLRVHYTMDVFAGLMAALYVAGVAAWLASPCDRVLAYAFAAS